MSQTLSPQTGPNENNGTSFCRTPEERERVAMLLIRAQEIYEHGMELAARERMADPSFLNPLKRICVYK